MWYIIQRCWLYDGTWAARVYSWRGGGGGVGGGGGLGYR